MPQPELPIIQKTYDLLKWLIPKIEKFPRSQKLVLGDGEFWGRRLSRMCADFFEEKNVLASFS